MCTTSAELATSTSTSATAVDDPTTAAVGADRERPPRWTAGRVVWASVATAAAFTAAATAAAIARVASGADTLAWAASTPNAALKLGCGLAAIAALAGAAGRGPARAARLGLRRPAAGWARPTIVVTVALLVATVPFLDSYTRSAGIADGASNVLLYSSTAMALHLLTRVVAIPVLHELFFRSMLTGWLADATGSRAVAIGVAALVAAVTAPSYAIGVLTAGALSWLYLRTASVWPTIAASGATALLIFTATTI